MFQATGYAKLAKLAYIIHEKDPHFVNKKKP